jgi:hypothetical protein
MVGRLLKLQKYLCFVFLLGLFCGTILGGFFSANKCAIIGQDDVKIETNTSSYNYLGAFSFTDDAVGAHPAGWTVQEGSNTYTHVIDFRGTHRKVVEFWDNDAGVKCSMYNNFGSAKTYGTIEFWVYNPNIGNNKNLYYTFYTSNGGTGTLAFGFYLDGTQGLYTVDYLADIISAPNFPSNQWYHIRTEFNCSIDKNKVWVDGQYKGEFNFRNTATEIKSSLIQTSPSYSQINTYYYIDAIDYSWAPGYYLNRNWDYESVDYLGQYSFTKDAIGSHPADWYPGEGTNGYIDVIQTKALHNKVVQLDSTGGVAGTDLHIQTPLPPTGMDPPKVTGTIELWVYIDSGRPFYNSKVGVMVYGTLMSSYYREENMGPNLFFEPDNRITYLCNAAPPFESGDFLATGYTWKYNEWMHIRLSWDTTTDIYNGWVNGTLVVNAKTFARPQPSGLVRQYIGFLYSKEGWTGRCYVDAVDFSWASGYYTNRNMDSTYTEENNDDQRFEYLALILIICGIIAAIVIASTIIYTKYRPHNVQQRPGSKQPRPEPTQSRQPRRTEDRSTIPRPYIDTVTVIHLETVRISHADDYSTRVFPDSSQIDFEEPKSSQIDFEEPKSSQIDFEEPKSSQIDFENSPIAPLYPPPIILHCPNCGAKYEKDQTFCANCGSEL